MDLTWIVALFSGAVGALLLYALQRFVERPRLKVEPESFHHLDEPDTWVVRLMNEGLRPLTVRRIDARIHRDDLLATYPGVVYDLEGGERLHDIRIEGRGSVTCRVRFAGIAGARTRTRQEDGSAEPDWDRCDVLCFPVRGEPVTWVEEPEPALPAMVVEGGDGQDEDPGQAPGGAGNPTLPGWAEGAELVLVPGDGEDVGPSRLEDPAGWIAGFVRGLAKPVGAYFIASVLFLTMLLARVAGDEVGRAFSSTVGEASQLHPWLGIAVLVGGWFFLAGVVIILSGEVLEIAFRWYRWISQAADRIDERL